MHGRCVWSNRESVNLKEVVLDAPNRIGMRPAPRAFHVLPEYEEELRRFIERVRRFAVLFVSLMTLLSVATVFCAVLGQLTFLGLTVVLMGLVLLVLPFPTPETVNAFGLKKSIILVRAIALVVIVLGVYLAARLR